MFSFFLKKIILMKVAYFQKKCHHTQLQNYTLKGIKVSTSQIYMAAEVILSPLSGHSH